ncbi:Pollen Ole e 1 allergen and extensin family protein [Trema orientale]|uniref:Pollen Ole e 1 allergen and extensin family protein n=1 Tax=Trema orientale TaxID=63057 RepID=A0A2P5B6S4_TREOI|nr:Pollen Ole e 1 allergen and extensin family protein [Trema orientale]
MAYLPVLLLSVMLIAMSSVADCQYSHQNDVVGGSGTITNLLPLTAVIRVRGVLLCSVPPPSPPGSPPVLPQLNGVNVALSCDGGRSTIADVVTDVNGVFEFTTRATDTIKAILFGPSQSGTCFVSTRFPIAGCGVTLPTGILRAPVRPVQTYAETVHGGRHVVHECNVGRFSFYPPPPY